MTEAGFVGAITACSIVNLVLVYMLARQEWDRPWALLAMGLAAVYPLDVLCSTLFAPDMILATYCFMAIYLGWQWARFGDWLYHISVENRVSIVREILLDYPRMLFARNEYGAYFAGYYPHALVLLAVVFIRRARGAGKWTAFFAIMLAGLAALPAHRENGQWVLLVPHIFRYLPLVSIPLCLALAAYLREGLLRHRGVGAAMTVGFVGLSIVQCVALTAPTRDAFGEQRRAIAVLRDFPEEPVWCDDFFSFRLMSFARSSQEAHRVRLVRVDDPVRQALFATIKDGIVVTGGSSLPWWGCPRCTANLGAHPGVRRAPHGLPRGAAASLARVGRRERDGPIASRRLTLARARARRGLRGRDGAAAGARPETPCRAGCRAAARDVPSWSRFSPRAPHCEIAHSGDVSAPGIDDAVARALRYRHEHHLDGIHAGRTP